MDRKILLQVTAPAVVIGLVLFGTCLISAWIVNRLQTNMARILSQNVASLEAASDVQVHARRLRFQCFRYLLDSERRGMAERDQRLRDDIRRVERSFEESVAAARRSAHTAEEKECVRQIDEGYRQYRREFEDLLTTPAVGPPRSYRDLLGRNPIHLVIDPCERYAEVNHRLMNHTRQDSDTVSHTLQVVLLFLGLGGPVSGLIIGFGMARGLTRSIHRLSVRVHDVASQLDQDVASVSVVPDGDVRNLDRQLQHLLSRVQEVVGQLQQQQREVVRAQHLSAVGQLAASVAHEVRNPLTAIKMLVEAALRERNPRPFTRENLTVVRNEVARLEKTVQNFLDFTRPPPAQRHPCDLRAIVAEAAALVHVRAEQQKVTVTVCAGDQLATAALMTLGDRGQLRSVLVNLLLNALDALSAGGWIEVTLGQAAPGTLAVAVRDNGTGIPPAMTERLFTPFASTKPTGTGLGLCVSRRIVEEHGGVLRGENLADGGACFTLTLPEVTG